MKSLAEVIAVRIILQLFTIRVSERYIAEQYHLSPSMISSLVNNYTEFVKSRISQIKQDMVRLKQLYCDTLQNEVIWIDETFFKIAKKCWAPIMAVNVQADVVGWKLSRIRTSRDVGEMLTMADTAMPYIGFIIGDGAKSYPAEVLKQHRDCMLIQHIHSHPWQDVLISQYEVLSGTSVTQSVVEVDYNSLYSNQLQVGYAVEKNHKPASNGKRGRPKGSMNKKITKPKPKRRDPITPRSRGEAFVFQTNTSTSDQFLDISIVNKDIQINHASKTNPESLSCKPSRAYSGRFFACSQAKPSFRTGSRARMLKSRILCRIEAYDQKEIYDLE